MQNVQFIVNPNASNGRCGKVWRQTVERRLKGMNIAYEVHFTGSPGHGTEIAAGLPAKAGAVVSVGGDGTHSEVVSGLMRRKATKRQPILGCLTLGTGGDFRRTLQLPVDPLAQLKVILDDLQAKRFVPIDLGRLDYIDSQGAPAQRGFLNIASFGIGGEVDDRVNRTTKLFGGFASFLIGSVRAAVGYKNKPVELQLDGNSLGAINVFNVAVANGCYFGGGMHVAPEARPNDGLFDVVLLEDMTFAEKLAFTPHLYRGTLLNRPKVRLLRGRKLVATSTETVLLDVDGEQPGRLPATFTIEPEALLLLGAGQLA